MGFCSMVTGEGRRVAQSSHFHIQADRFDLSPMSTRITCQWNTFVLLVSHFVYVNATIFIVAQLAGCNHPLHRRSLSK